MKTITLLAMTFLGIVTSLMAHKPSFDSIIVTSGNENYSIINISRSYTYQEWRGSGKIIQMVYINDQPVCELQCQSRVSIKVFSQGKINLSVKYIPNKKYKQKTIDKQFLSGPPLEIDVVHGKTSFINVDLKVKEGALLVYFTAQLVAIPESESMFREEERFKKFPEIIEYQEDVSQPFIKTN
jgi:hypothetical protein